MVFISGFIWSIESLQVEQEECLVNITYNVANSNENRTAIISTASATTSLKSLTADVNGKGSQLLKRKVIKSSSHYQKLVLSLTIDFLNTSTVDEVLEWNLLRQKNLYSELQIIEQQKLLKVKETIAIPVFFWG